MSTTIGMSDHPALGQMEELWRQGNRAAEIIEWLEDNDLPQVKSQTINKYGQRNWSEYCMEDVDVPESHVEAVRELLDEIRSTDDLGSVERVSVSRTGYSVSIRTANKVKRSALEKLPKQKKSKPKKNRKTKKPSTIVVIPDTQVAPGRPTEHLGWASEYVLDHYSDKPIKIVHIGDHWDMPSLSSYDKGKGAMEGRRYIDDIEAGNEAFELLAGNWEDQPWEKHLTIGNHTHRIDRVVEDDIRLEGLLTTDHCITPPSWHRHGFLEPVWLDGICFSHYFYNQNNGRPYGGTVDSRLKQIGHSFVMGHQQGLKVGHRYVGEQQQIGLVAGSFYLHEEDYMGPQGTGYWRGIVILEHVVDGSADIHPVSVDQLREMYG